MLMHTRGRSRDMYQHASYGDVVAEVLDELRASISFATGAGIEKERILIDPGLGFAKEPTHSFEALARLDEFSELGGRSSSARRGNRFSHGRSAASARARARLGHGGGSDGSRSRRRAHRPCSCRRRDAAGARVADEIRRYHRVDS